MANTHADYRSLKVWQVAMSFVTRCYEMTKDFPASELYGLTSQIRRAAVSVPANIAEGHARDSTKEYLHHVSIALGSAAELQTLLQLSRPLGFAEPWIVDDCTMTVEE